MTFSSPSLVDTLVNAFVCTGMRKYVPIDNYTRKFLCLDQITFFQYKFKFLFIGCQNEIDF